MKVTVAERAAVDVFADAVNDTDTFPLPDVRDKDTHAALDDTDHDVFDVTATDVVAPAAGGAHDEPDNVSVGAAAATPACETDTVRVTAGDPEVVVKVTVAVRADVDVFAAAVNDTETFPLPDVRDKDTHAALDDTDHDVFDVTATDVDAPAATGAQVDAARVKVGAAAAAPACVTATVRVCAGDPAVVVKVTVAVRAEVAVFA